MRITIVNGFFLPVPPLSGGSTEKTWFQLGREFAARGHQVVSLSRTWRTFPDRETLDGVEHIRLPGQDHQSQLWKNLLLDFAWSWRAYRELPPADIVVCNAVALPMWLGRWKPAAGRVVVMCGRMPKGQYRRYRALSRVLAPSSLVRERLLAENPALADTIRVTGYPINWSQLATPQPEPMFLPKHNAPGEVTLGFVGRINQEKGLLLLADALKLLAARPDLPPWRAVLCGPADVARGGSGADFRNRLLRHLGQALPSNRFHLLDPQFNDRVLAGIYQRLDVFCYPSLAAQGETFGVAVVEAMAAGAVPVVSNLECFRDFIRHGENGFVFDHAAPDAAAQLAAALESAVRDAARRRAMADTARADARRYDFPIFAEMLLTDFASLADSKK
jgi:glycosyltransferase involved in cell wall biosynthesis